MVKKNLLLIALALSLGGCSTLDKTASFFYDDEPAEKSRKERLYEEPKPGQGTGLQEVWQRSVSGDPDKYMFHPKLLAFDANHIYVGSFDGEITRLDKKRGGTLWQEPLGGPIRGGVAVDGQAVYAGTANGELVALNLQDGSELWRASLSSAAASAPLAVDNMVIIVTLDNRTYAFNATTGSRVWTHASVPEMLTIQGASTPTVMQDSVVVGYSSGEVLALARKSGKIRWRENLTRISRSRGELDRLQDVDADPVVSGKALYAVNHKGQLLALLQENGNRVWKYNTSAIRTPLIYKETRMVIVDLDGFAKGLNAMEGTLAWKTMLSDGLLTSPILYKGRVYLGDDTGRLFSLDPLSGKVVGLDRIDDPILSLTVIDDQLAIWTNEGDLTLMQ
uniref:Pyrrolo-quinoline quinone repeat domain-containing protein n=1 Tax=Magnetococcus massalia (strain MO-1) TaxID=451514 RepID=A0A1S7LMR1_MAGMO|nr:conserved protein of unknown function. Containing Pyrrolo-quinoline quinone (PQQ) enzyme repeat domain [Candidatus Magnetococcus massalia]